MVEISDHLSPFANEWCYHSFGAAACVAFAAQAWAYGINAFKMDRVVVTPKLTSRLIEELGLGDRSF